MFLKVLILSLKKIGKINECEQYSEINKGKASRVC